MALADNLIFAQDFRGRSGPTCTSLQGDTGTLSGTTPPTWAADGLVFPGGAETVGYVNYGAIARVQDLWLSAAMQRFAFFARVFPTANVGGGILERNNGVDNGVAFGVSPFGTKLGLGLVKGRNAGQNHLSYYSTASGGLTINAWSNIALSDNLLGPTSGAGGTGFVLPLWVNGVAKNSTTNAEGWGDGLTDAANPLYIGRTSLPSLLGVSPAPACFTGKIAVVYIWRRALIAADITALTANPFALVAAAPSVGAPALFLGV